MVGLNLRQVFYLPLIFDAYNIICLQYYRFDLRTSYELYINLLSVGSRFFQRAGPVLTRDRVMFGRARRDQNPKSIYFPTVVSFTL